MTIPAPPKWVDLSDAEKSAARAAAYPGLLDDQGREWKMGMIIDLQAEIDRLRKELIKVQHVRLAPKS